MLNQSRCFPKCQVQTCTALVLGRAEGLETFRSHSPPWAAPHAPKPSAHDAASQTSSRDVQVADPNRHFLTTTQQTDTLRQRMWPPAAIGWSCSHRYHVSDFYFSSKWSTFEAWHYFGSCPVSSCVKHKWPEQGKRLLGSFPFLIPSSL